ncbi:hypothetical protein K457DRAFT_122940, partial [Linnemannia elongata AG-77]
MHLFSPFLSLSLFSFCFIFLLPRLFALAGVGTIGSQQQCNTISLPFRWDPVFLNRPWDSNLATSSKCHDYASSTRPKNVDCKDWMVPQLEQRGIGRQVQTL